ncbi:hypothetical protein, partial [Enterobacter kobei]|uniref:hypothetical protein n=1 Tax=Enterobacter kobei TaxID=208224 RepID=UPI0022E27604
TRRQPVSLSACQPVSLSACQPVSQLVGDGSELSKVVAPYQRHREFLSVPTLSYSCFKQLSLLKLEQDWLFYY